MDVCVGDGPTYPVDGSSANTTIGLPHNAIPSDRRRFMPPLSSDAFMLNSSPSRFTFSAVCCTRTRAAWPWMPRRLHITSSTHTRVGRSAYLRRQRARRSEEPTHRT